MLKKGFTLLELLLVIAIISVLAGLVIFAIRPADTLRRVNSVKKQSESVSVEDAIKAYTLDNSGAIPQNILNYSGTYPANICRYGQTCANGINLDVLIDAGYIQAIPVNPEPAASSNTVSGYKIDFDSSNLSVDVNPYDDNEKVGCLNQAVGDYQAKIIVAPSGCNYTTVQLALAAITDASASKKYLISVMPGTYSGSTVVMKPYVDVIGAGIDSTIMQSNFFAASNSAVKNLTITLSGNRAWEAAYDAFSPAAAANPTYIENVKINYSTNTGPIYPLLTKTGSFMYATNVTLITSAKANGGDGFYAITHNAGGGVFKNLNVTMTMNSGGTGRDDMGIVNTFWASNSTIEDSTFTLINNATTNNNEDDILDKDQAANLTVKNTTITYTSVATTKPIKFLRTVGGGTFLFQNLTATVNTLSNSGNFYGIDDIVGGTINNLNLTVNKAGGGSAYGIRTTNSATRINNSIVTVSNTTAGGVAYGLHVQASSPILVGNSFTATDDGSSSSYGGYVTNVTCNPTFTSTTFTGTTSNLFVNTGCVPVIN